MLKVLEGFHHRAERQITGMTAKRGACGEWEYPFVVGEMEAKRPHSIWVYIRRQQVTIAERVACRTIYELCTEEKRMLGTSRMVQWWDQDAVNEPKE